MEQYISKSALVAEIERRIDSNNEKAASYSSGSEHDYLCRVKENVYKDLISFLNTIEVKEVDLEKEIELVKGDYEQVDVAWNKDFDFIARHFFELGLKSKGK